MSKKRITPENTKQLDIFKLFKNKEEIVEDEEENVEEKTTNVKLFDFINDIRKYKKGDLLDSEQNLNQFSSYMILKGLSMNEDDIFICNTLNQYTNVLDKKMLYQALLNLIPKNYNFYPWIKNINEKTEDVEYVCKVFECSKKEAIEYINIMGTEWVLDIKEKFGV